MIQLDQKYCEIFKPANEKVHTTYLEGVENCVCKNLYTVIFGDNGIGTNPMSQVKETLADGS